MYLEGKEKAIAAFEEAIESAMRILDMDGTWMSNEAFPILEALREVLEKAKANEI